MFSSTSPEGAGANPNTWRRLAHHLSDTLVGQEALVQQVCRAATGSGVLEWGHHTLNLKSNDLHGWNKRFLSLSQRDHTGNDKE